MDWWSNRKRLKLLRAQQANALWIWIGRVNISRDAPHEMIGPQNLSQIPDWLLPDLCSLADIIKERKYTFKEDKVFEYRFKPTSDNTFISSFYCDIYKRIRHWRKIVRNLPKNAG